jgi:pectin methylesterase-like acyl-CoA thioesterase/PKD repeat protein
MRTTKHLPEITPSFYQPLHRLVVTLALVMGLLVGAVSSHANTYTWTNTTGAAFNDPTAWNPPSGPPGLNDTASFTINGTFDVPLTNNYISNIGTLLIGAASSSGTLTMTMDFGTNTFAGISGNSSSASGFVFGQTGTCTVYIACGSILCTNSGNNARLIVGRQNGPTTVILTNGFVADGNLVIANGTTANGSKVVVSGPNSFWSNATTIAVGNTSITANNSLVISNSGSMVGLSTILVGNTQGGFNSLLLDSGGRLFIKNVGSIGSAASASNNTATVQGGAIWDCGGQKIFVGSNVSGPSNSLTVGNNGVVSNASFVSIGAGNSLILSNGFLTVSGGVTNTSGIVSGSGTIVGNLAFASGGSLSLGAGTSVGTLILSNSLTLTSTSTTTLKLDKTQTGSNDLLAVLGTANEAGTLTINNTGPALVGGDAFTILALTSPTGGFIFTNLPPLTGTLIWNTTQLGPQGVISVVLPPTITGPSSQAVLTNANVTISTVVTGVPTPNLRWQLNGVNLTDGATGNGSTISGSTSPVLTISNAQTNDSGQYCLIATNFGGSVTNCMSLTVTTAFAAPAITGPTDQNVILGQNGTFSASVAGIPTPTQQWQQNGVDILGATGLSVTVNNVQFSQDGFVYSIIASNSQGTATNSAVLHVVIPPTILTQPQSLVVTTSQSACFSVVSTNGVPAPTYQWQFNNVNINGATNATYCIASATPANAGAYNVTVANVGGSVTSSNATLTVDSTMAATLTPGNGAVNVCYDTPLFMAFNQTPVLSGAGKVKIYNMTNSATPVDTIDTGAGLVQARSIGGDGSFVTYPVIINGNTVQVYPHLGVLSSNQQYYVTVDAGIFTDTTGALYVGITTTNGWTFTTKPTGPANPLSVVVATNESADFATVQGAVDSVPLNNTTPTLINIQNGQYTELVDITSKNNLTFRGQSRDGVLVGYPNNVNINSGTSARMAFKVNANDIAIDNMTITNMTAKGGGQAEALEVYTNAKRCILNNAVVSSFQDTILINDFTSQAYFYKSLIKGDTDFIWGLGDLFVTNCEIRTVTGAASITQPRTPAGSNGLDFVNCQLTRSSSTVSNTTFARALGFCDGNAAFINCQIDSNVVGWTASDLSGCPNIRWWEYGNVDLLTGNPVSYNGTILTNGDPRLACAESATCWLNGWVPQLAPNILTNPVSVTVTAGVTATFSVAATGVPDPSYQWLMNGTNVINATANNATLVISNALAGDAGLYSVIVSNIAGTVTSSNATLTVVGTGPTASFTASPTFGTEPLGVTFTDTSSGSPLITLFWDFGDSSQATNAGGSSFVHTYAAGTYNVTLTASNAFGANSTLVSNSLITVLTAFQAWQSNYFGCTACPQAQPNADPYGKGMSNMNQFLAGLNPTNPASLFTVISTAGDTTNVVIVWKTAGVRTNAVQATAGDGNGGYVTTNFTDISGPIVIGVPGDTTTNYTDVGGATNSPARYYRIRLVP